MASFKTLLFACVVVASVAVPKAEANVIDVTGLIHIYDTLYCTANGSVGAAGPLLTPKFTNATVVLRCGAANTTTASVTTNSLGTISIVLDISYFNLVSTLKSCRLVVTTPLAACNATLTRTQTLIAPLRLVGPGRIGNLLVFVLAAAGFRVTA